MANSIIAGNDFRLIIRAKKSTGAYLADMDLADVEDLRIYLTRAGRSKVLQSYTLDEEGHAVIYVSAGVVTNATYGIEMVGVYGGARLRAHNTSVFTISGHGGGNSGVLNDYYADIIFVINVAATDVYVQNAIEAHNEDEASHPHLLQLIEEAGDVDDVQIDGESIVDENKIAKIDSSQFGKVDDVKVNGTSVVSNKEANITIPEKVSDLPNDADYATKSELTTGLDAKQDTITAVAEPTIADDGGNPSASVEFEGGEMAFAFRNLKLRFSDLTAADKAELKGDKGDQGDSAVYDPSSPDAPDFEMANTTGQSTTKAMTQKAVTDELLSVDHEINMGGPIFVPAYIASATGKWVVDSGQNPSGGKFIAVMPGYFYKITTLSGVGGVYAFLTSDSHVVGTTPSYAEGSARTALEVDETVIAEAPSNANYLYVFTSNAGSDRTPTVVEMRKRKDMINADTLVENRIDLSGLPISNSYIAGTGIWWDDVTPPIRSKFIPVTAGKIYSIESINGITLYAFLSSDSHDNEDTPSYAQHACRVRMESGQKNVEKAPVDAHYLYVVVESQNENREPVFCELVTPNEAFDQVRNLSEDGIYYRPVDCIGEFPSYHYDIDGDVLPYEEGEGGYNFILMRKFAVNQVDDFYCTARVAPAATVPSVAYYDAEDNFLSFDSGFLVTGVARYLSCVKMSIPANAAYCLVIGTLASTNMPWPPCVYEGTWKIKKDVTPFAIEYHEATIRGELIPTDTTFDPTSATEIENSHVKSGWAVMWPSTYTSHGKPTQVIAMLHGAVGYVTPSVMGYTLDTWKKWRDTYLQNGYAVFDINGYGVSTGSDAKSKHFGNPRAMETIDKAFEYLKEHYNVCDKLLLHGTSMGGGAAMNYAKTYPNKVLAVACFAPGIAIRSAFKHYDGIDVATATAWGYESVQQMKEDRYSHMFGFSPFAKCHYVTDQGSLMEVEWDDETQAWPAEFDPDWKLIEYLPVPIRFWVGTNDTNSPTGTIMQMVDALRRGHSTATLRLYQGANHSLTTGAVQAVVNESIEYFKRYSG